ncbi:MAG TPA: response regulator [Steroidobacteraceae bacterium]|jgi:signal transduction histidine kinase|nr:response regulator [Steroidobacteraceae bacterium]
MSEIEEKVSILLVDDQPQRLVAYRAILADLGLDLVCAHSGREALELLMDREFAVVLLDVSMPDMDGFEAAKLIHEHPRFERTPIIFVTGVHLDDLDRLKGYSLGAVDYVSVPIVPEILRSKVSVLVELYCKRKELQRANIRLSAANIALQEEKTRELQVVNHSLQRANSELEAANRSLQSEIAERTRAEKALKEADRHKDEFLAMLAHELRNPLAPIHNAIELMRMRPLDDPQLNWARDVIARQLTSLTRLVDDLLDVSRITRGKINLTRQVVELEGLISRAVETVHPLFDQHAHQLTLELPEPGVKVFGDPTRLTQAIANVLGNAAKYTDSGGQVSLAATVRDRDVEIRVRDNGIGIRPEMLPHVFELFTQLDRGDGRTQGGLGIGLALVQQLVQMHGGNVSAASDGPGKGSEFVIRLPLLRGVDEPVETPPPLATPTAEVGRPSEVATVVTPLAAASAAHMVRRILIADDNNDALESLATLLQLSGHEVFTATNGGTALQSAERHLPEVALLDIGMPLLDGYEVAKRIRSQPWGERITLVALTGWGQDSDRRRSREAGFDSHLVKPLDLDTLTDLLARLPSAAARRPATGGGSTPFGTKSSSG